MHFGLQKIFLLGILNVVLFHKVESKKPNVCPEGIDYFTLGSNKKCYYVDDYDLDVPSLIKKYTGNSETHEIVTEDGYILNMFRIPRKNPKGIFLFQHALVTNCLVYLLQGEDSIAFYLWRHGYEVWLNNKRGTIFSTKHVNLTIEDPKYWDFSFHEVGYYDMDAQVKYIREKTNYAKMFFYGYSLGTTEGLIYQALRPKAAEESFKAFIHVGLTCYYKYNTSISIRIARFVGLLRLFYKSFNLRHGALPMLPSIRALIYFIYKTLPIHQVGVYAAQLLGTGQTPQQLDPRQMGSTDFARIVDNISIRTLLHLFQIMNAQTRLEMYDFGKEQNRLIYGKETPDLYPIENITTPTIVVYGESDVLTTKKDALLFYEKLQPRARIYGGLEVEGLNHEDVNFGKQRRQRFFDKLLELIEKI